jgi:hypothetical protein
MGVANEGVTVKIHDISPWAFNWGARERRIIQTAQKTVEKHE